MTIMITAPFRIGFCLSNGMTAYKTDEFYKLWDRAKEKIDKNDLFNIEYHHTSEQRNKKLSNKEILYSDINKDSIDERKVFSIRLNNIAKIVDNSKHLDKKIFGQIQDCELQIYNNTIGIVKLDIDLREEEIAKKEYRIKYLELTKTINEQINIFIYEDILLTCKDKINSLIKQLEYYDSDHIIQRRGHYTNFIDMNKNMEQEEFRILWASKAINVENQNSFNEGFLRAWLEGVENLQEIEEFFSNSKASSLSWLNYAFREDCENVSAKWEAMFLAQYYYAVIEKIINNLKLIINESYKKGHKKSLRDLFKKDDIILMSKKLEEISATANLHIIEYKDIQKYLNREKLKVFNSILDSWSFGDIIENTEKLLSTTKERVDLIYNKISAKNSFQTDILLTFIGLFSIIDLVLSFYQYSREYTADAMISSRGGDESVFLQFLSNIQTDNILSFGLGTSIIALIFYLVHRKKIVP